MRKISKKNLEIIDTDPYYKKCARRDEGNCDGRISIEHVFIYAGRQVDEIWNLLPICTYHHGVLDHMEDGDMNKEKHEWLALNRADDATLIKYSKAVDLIHKRKYLNDKYNLKRTT